MQSCWGWKMGGTELFSKLSANQNAVFTKKVISDWLIY
jgi:hypothetical protein